MDLIENRPFESRSQTNLSCLGDIGIGMLRMALASVGANSSLTKFEIHDLEMESMRSLALMDNFLHSSSLG